MSAAGAISYVGLLLTLAGLFTFTAAKLARPVGSEAKRDATTARI
jgi:hypothetical protein